MMTKICRHSASRTVTAICLLVVANRMTGPHCFARQPNIVLIIADDLGYGELGCQGNDEIPTPNIDRLAAQGTRMTSGYVTASFCSASRAGLMTGRYQTRFGYEFNPIGERNVDPRVGIPKDIPTMAEVLRDAGYATALVGKWHLGGHASQHPLRRGFDEFFGFLHEGHYYVPSPYDGVATMLRRRALPGGARGRWQHGDLVLSTHMNHNEPPYDADNPLLRNGQPIVDTRYLTRAFAAEAVGFIRRHRDRPFFLCLATNAVHSPLQAEKNVMERLPHIADIHRRIFAAMLVSLDDAVGEVEMTLSQLELQRDTLVIFLSDNGGPTKELTSSNLPLRGGKGSLYEGGTRVPFIVKWPEHIAAGKTFDSPVISLDILPTAMAAAGIDRKDRMKLDGVNLLPFLNGRSTGEPKRDLFWRMGRRAALRSGRWKIVRSSGRRSTRSSWQLYDLSRDLSERHDVASSHPEILSQLLRRWERLNAEMAEPLFE